MILSNCTNSPRGIALRRGIIILQPREVRPIPDALRGEFAALLRTETFQRLLDNGIFRLSPLSDDDAGTDVKTPPPPPELAAPVSLDGLLETAVSPRTGRKACPPKVVGYQHDLRENG